MTALGVYMAVVGNGHLPDREVVARAAQERLPLGAERANEAIMASGLSPRAFYRRQLDYPGPVLALWGDRDRLVPIAHRDGWFGLGRDGVLRALQRAASACALAPRVGAGGLDEACELARSLALGVVAPAAGARRRQRRPPAQATYQPPPNVAGLRVLPTVGAR